MGRIIEAKAVISAEDRTGKAFDSIARKFKEVGKGAKAAVDVGKLGKEAERAAAALKEIERFRGVQASFTQARTTFRTTQAEVARLASALDGARKAAAAFDGVKSFSKNGAVAQEMAAARKQVTDLERQLTSAQRSVKAAATAFESQSAALKAVKGDLSGSGVAIGRLVAEENRLKGALDGANAALNRQGQLMQANGKLADGMAAAGRRQSAELQRQAEAKAQSQRLAQGMSAAGRPSVVALPQSTGTMAGGAPTDPVRDGRGGYVEAASGLGVGVVLGGAYNRARDGWLEMDEATRRQRAILGIDTVQQKTLNAQALKIGQDTRFSNPDVVKAQTRIGSSLPDHLKDPEVLKAITEHSKNYALAMGTTMDQASEALLGRMLGMRKDMSTPEAAGASAQDAANKLVQWAKSSGADHNDIMGYTKFGAAPGNVGGFSEEFSDALSAQLRRIGFEGSMGGNFVRAAATKLAVPTTKGLGALAAAGIEHSDYVQQGKELSAQNLNKALKLKFGKGLTDSQQARIHALMQDESVVGNRDEFVPQVSEIVQETLARKTKKGSVNAQDAKSIAKSVNEFLNVSAGAVDIERLMRDVIPLLAGSPALSKYLFGQEHGGRAQALDVKTLDKDVQAFRNTPRNRAAQVGEDINKGAYGAYQRMIGSVETFYMRLGQVTDGPLTRFYDLAGNVVDKVANLPDGVLRMGVAAAGVTGALVAFKGAVASFNLAKGLLGGDTALKGSAVALDGSAAALTRAAVALGAKGALPGAPGTVGADGKNPKKAPGKLASAAGTLGSVAAGVALGPLAQAAVDNNVLSMPSFEHGFVEGGLRFLDPRLGDMVYGDRAKTFPTMALGNPGLQGDGPAYPALTALGPDGMGGIGNTGTLGFGLSGPQDPAAIARALQGPGGFGPQGPRLPSLAVPTQRPLAPEGPAAGGSGLAETIRSILPSWLGGSGGAVPVEVKALPSGADASGQAGAINNTLDKAANASATAANGGQPLEATVKPDQITARIDQIPPVSGEATVTVENHHQITVTLNTEMLDAKVNAAAGRAVANLPLSSGAARPGAATMPGAAAPPGNR